MKRISDVKAYAWQVSDRASCSNSIPPPLPPDPPKFLNPSVSKLRVWGKVLTPKAPKNFFALLAGYFFFYPMCLSSKYSEFRGEFTNG